MKTRQLQIAAWGSSAVVSALAVVAWGQGIAWRLSDLTTYQLFPLFGLLAFSLMWSHYVVSALRRYFKIDRAVLHVYFETTSLAVLAAILLHPGLLTWQLWRDGLGLPPGSELDYVGDSLRGAVILGMIALLIFLAYEFRRKFGDRSWWKLVQYASDGAMALIFVHALKLGGQLRLGWFRTIWFLYGVTLAGSLAYIYYKRISELGK